MTLLNYVKMPNLHFSLSWISLSGIFSFRSDRRSGDHGHSSAGSRGAPSPPQAVSSPQDASSTTNVATHPTSNEEEVSGVLNDADYPSTAVYCNIFYFYCWLLWHSNSIISVKCVFHWRLFFILSFFPRSRSPRRRSPVRRRSRSPGRRRHRSRSSSNSSR